MPPKTHVLVPSPWCFGEEVGPSGRSSDHWKHAIEGDCGAPPSLLFSPDHEVSIVTSLHTLPRYAASLQNQSNGVNQS
jgi:hypothetical protein